MDNNLEISLNENLLQNLANLKHLSLNKCGLKDKLINLFSDNTYNLPQIDYFSLSGNSLTQISFNKLMIINLLDLSSNKFVTIDYKLINNNDINVINYDYNAIDSLNLNLVNKSISLSLRFNQIETLSTPNNRDNIVVNMYLTGNPLKCDCNSLWLQSYNQSDYKNIILSDFNQLECSFLGNLEIGMNKKLIIDSKYGDYKCQYTTNCNFMCNCCSY